MKRLGLTLVMVGMGALAGAQESSVLKEGRGERPSGIAVERVEATGSPESAAPVAPIDPITSDSVPLPDQGIQPNQDIVLQEEEMTPEASLVEATPAVGPAVGRVDTASGDSYMTYETAMQDILQESPSGGDGVGIAVDPGSGKLSMSIGFGAVPIENGQALSLTLRYDESGHEKSESYRFTDDGSEWLGYLLSYERVADNPMVAVAENWHFAEVPLLYMKMDRRNYSPNIVEHASYWYYELWEDGKVYRFYRDTPVIEDYFNFNDGLNDGYNQAGLYAYWVYDLEWNCTPCTTPYSYGEIVLSTQDGSNRRLILSAENSAQVVVENPDGSRLVFEHFATETDFPSVGSDAVPAIYPHQSFEEVPNGTGDMFEVSYNDTALSRPHYLVRREVAGQDETIEYRYNEVSAADPYGRNFRYYQLSEMCSGLMPFRCLTLSLSEYDGVSGTGTIGITRRGFAGFEQRYELILNDRSLERIVYPEDDTGVRGEVRFGHQYALSGNSGAWHGRVVRVYPMHPEGEDGSASYAIDYHDRMVVGLQEYSDFTSNTYYTILWEPLGSNYTGSYSYEWIYADNQVAALRRVYGDGKEERWGYDYELNVLNWYEADTAYLDVVEAQLTFGDYRVDTNDDTIYDLITKWRRYLTHRAANLRDVTVTAPDGSRVVHTVSLGVTRLPFEWDTEQREEWNYFGVVSGVFGPQTGDISVFADVVPGLYYGEGGSELKSTTVGTLAATVDVIDQTPGHYMMGRESSTAALEYRGGGASGPILRTDTYDPEGNLLHRQDWAHDQVDGALFNRPVQTTQAEYYRTDVDASVRGDVLKARYTYDPYGRQVSQKTAVVLSESEEWVQAEGRQSYAELPEEAGLWKLDLPKLSYAKELTDESDYSSWANHDVDGDGAVDVGWVQTAETVYDFELGEPALGRVREAIAGDPADPYGRIRTHYLYYTDAPQAGDENCHDPSAEIPNVVGDLLCTYSEYDNPAWDGEPGHVRQGPSRAYAYFHGIPVVEMVQSESDGDRVVIERTIDRFSGLPMWEGYLDGTSIGFHYDRLGRRNEVSGYDADGVRQDAVSVEYRDFGRQVISWRSPDPNVTEDGEGNPIFNPDDTQSGHYDQWSWVYFDAFGHLLRKDVLGVEIDGQSDSVLSQCYAYNFQDQPIAASELSNDEALCQSAAAGTGGVGIATTSYDNLGRVVYQDDGHGGWSRLAYNVGDERRSQKTVMLEGVERTWTSETDYLGQLSRVAEPLDEETSESLTSRYRYDYAGRLISTYFADRDDQASRSFAYSTVGLLKESFLPERRFVENRRYGVFGLEAWSDDAGVALRTEYDSFGQPRRVIEAATETVLSETEYDPRTLRPERASVYEAAHPRPDGSASSVSAVYGYDSAGRLNAIDTMIAYRDFPEVVFNRRLAYDGRSRVVAASDPDLIRYNGIDGEYSDGGLYGTVNAYGRSGARLTSTRGPLAEDLSLLEAGPSPQLRYGYDGMCNRLAQLDYGLADGTLPVRVNTSYDGCGGPMLGYRVDIGTEAQTLSLQQQAAAAWSAVVGYVTGEPTVAPTTASASIWSGTYRYDEGSGLLDAIGTIDEVEAGSTYRLKSYDYDQLGRLTYSSYVKRINGRAHELFQETFGYDVFGNLELREFFPRLWTGAPSASTGYTVDPWTNQIAATTSTDSALDGASFAYTDAGALSRIERPAGYDRLDYNSRHQLLTYLQDPTDDESDGNATASTYLYGPSGVRLVKEVQSPDGGREVLYTLYDGTTAGGKALATYRQQAGAETAPALSERLVYSAKGIAGKEKWGFDGTEAYLDTAASTYIVPNHLGESAVVVNGGSLDWQAVEALSYGEPLPQSLNAYLDVEVESGLETIFGEGDDSLTAASFGGHPKDEETGLSYMQLRFYDPALARFTKPDPLEAIAWETPQSFNLYSYVGNNPITKIDPTGGQAFNVQQMTPEDMRQMELTFSFLPIVGEFADIHQLTNPNNPGWVRGLSVFSLGLSVCTLTLAPNFGAVYRFYANIDDGGISGVSRTIRNENIPIDLSRSNQARRRPDIMDNDVARRIATADGTYFPHPAETVVDDVIQSDGVIPGAIPGENMYVVRTDGTLVIGPESVGEMRWSHANLARGEDVLDAGRIEIDENGRIINGAWDDESGHYYDLWVAQPNQGLNWWFDMHPQALGE